MKRKPKTVTLTTPSGHVTDRAIEEVAAALAFADLDAGDREIVRRRARALVGALSATRGGHR